MVIIQKVTNKPLKSIKNKDLATAIFDDAFIRVSIRKYQVAYHLILT